MKKFDVDSMIINDISVTFILKIDLKHSRKGKSIDKFGCRAYKDSKRLRVLDFLKENIFQSRKIVGLETKEHQLRISTCSIKRWTKGIFINNNIVGFSPQSCLAASVSKARAVNVNVDDIISIVCWKNRKNFFTFYSRDIINYSPNEID